MAITTTATLDLIKTGIDLVTTIQTKAAKETWRDIAEVINHDKGYYRERILASFSDMQTLAEGDAVVSDVKRSLYTVDVYPQRFAKAFELTLDMKEDDVYKQVPKFAQEIVKIRRRRRNKEVCNLFNNGFDTNYPIYDAAALFSASHPGVGSVTGSNLTTATSLGPIVLEDMMLSLMQHTDPMGEPMEFEGRMKLYTGVPLMGLATRILGSEKLAGGNDNDPNVTGRYITYSMQRFLTDTDAFFLRMADADEHGLRLIEFTQPFMDTDKELRSFTQLYAFMERYNTAVLQWQGVQGCAGS